MLTSILWLLGVELCLIENMCRLCLRNFEYLQLFRFKVGKENFVGQHASRS